MTRNSSFGDEKAKLYVIATPIGNLNEISERTIQAINDCSVIFCEDTRVTGLLLKHLNIKKALFSAYENIEKSASEKVLQYLNDNQNVGLISDAGYPAISDPGSIIIQEVIKHDYSIVVINGPSALIHSLVASGFDTSHFYFYGFLNAKETTRRKELEKLNKIEDTIILYQSPHKIKACLEDMLTILGDRDICLCRELSKKFEEYIRGKISEIIPICETLKGEMVIVIAPSIKEEAIEEIDDRMCLEIDDLINKGQSTKDAIKEIANKYNVNKSELYNFYHQRSV